MAFDLDDEELEATRILNGVEKKKRGITKDKVDDLKMKQKENENKLLSMKTELVKQEYQNNLKEIMEQKMFDLAYKLKHIEEGKDLSVIELKSLLSQKNTIGISPKYNNTELSILFDYYKQFIQEINKKTSYIPTKEDFCSFAGVSTTTYNNWKQSEDAERREIMQKIDDYLVDIHLSMAQRGDIREISTIFRAKSEFGMVEAQAPQRVEYGVTADMKQIMKNIDAINSGKSLKAIELEEGEDGVYRPKEN